MRIVCPACAATYDVPEGMLVGRQPVRCARCGEEWTPEPATLETADALGGPPGPPPAGPGPEPSAAMSAQSAAPVQAARADLPAGGDASPASVFERPHVPPNASEPRAANLRAIASGALGRLKTGRLSAVQGRPALAGAAWAGSLLLIFALGWAAYAWRGPIMHAWPPSERLYLALGLA